MNGRFFHSFSHQFYYYIITRDGWYQKSRQFKMENTERFLLCVSVCVWVSAFVLQIEWTQSDFNYIGMINGHFICTFEICHSPKITIWLRFCVVASAAVIWWSILLSIPIIWKSSQKKGVTVASELSPKKTAA